MHIYIFVYIWLPGLPGHGTITVHGANDLKYMLSAHALHTN